VRVRRRMDMFQNCERGFGGVECRSTLQLKAVLSASHSSCDHIVRSDAKARQAAHATDWGSRAPFLSLIERPLEL